MLYNRYTIIEEKNNNFLPLMLFDGLLFVRHFVEGWIMSFNISDNLMKYTLLVTET